MGKPLRYTIHRSGRKAFRCVRYALLLCLPLLGGCGGAQNFGGFQNSLGGDVGNNYNTPLGSRYGSNANGPSEGVLRGTYPMIETSFQLASIPGDPFDYEKVNVQVSLRRPNGGAIEVPAFFDGGTTWRMRYTPTAPGQYSVVSVKLNREVAHEDKLEKKEWTVSGEPQPGFLHVDKGDHSRFLFDSGERYYPLGQNLAWHTKDLPEIPELLGKLHTSGENWA